MSNTTTKASPKKDSLAIYLALAFIAGFVAGAAFAVYKMGPVTNQEVASQQNTINEQQVKAITNLEQEVIKNPDNFQAFTQLGNLYYDTGQYNKAVTAYEKSLELHSGNANIWTDLGTMYRRTDRPKKAIEAFEKATAMEPDHQNSRINKGVVLLYDLNDFEGAIKIWEELLEMHPDVKMANGQPFRNFVDGVKQQYKEQIGN